jgi:outer membrane immunogenic protein
MMGGFYVGPLAGIDSVRVSDGTDSASKTGAIFGVTAGYDLDMGNAVVGLEGEFADSSTKDSATDILVTGDSAKLSAGRDLYLGARLGFKAGSRTLVYVKGGYTNAKAKLTYDDGTGPLSGHDDLDGWRAGAGVEFAVAPHIAMRCEYRYFRLWRLPLRRREHRFERPTPPGRRRGYRQVLIDAKAVMAGRLK